MKPIYIGAFKIIAISLLIILVFKACSSIVGVFGDKTDMTDNSYLIENNTSDTLYIEKPMSGQDRPDQKIIYINEKQFLSIFPKSRELYYTDDSNKSFNEALTKWPVNDTFELIRNTDTLNFVFGDINKCKVEETEHGFNCFRRID